jgi:hypothetical protein
VLFLNDVLMVPSSSITVVANGERLTCSGFTLGEPVCLGNFECITDYFGGLRLSPRRGNDGAIFMGSTHSEASTPQWATIEDSPEEFLMASSGKEDSATFPPNGTARGPRSPLLQLRHGRRMLQPRWCFPYGWRCHGRKATSPPSNITLTMKDNRRNPMLDIPMPNQDRHHNGATLLTGRPQSWFSRMHLLGASLCSRQRGS